MGQCTNGLLTLKPNETSMSYEVRFDQWTMPTPWIFMVTLYIIVINYYNCTRQLNSPRMIPGTFCNSKGRHLPSLTLCQLLLNEANAVKVS